MFKTRADLKTYINTYIIPNGVRSITGTHGNTILTDMVDSLWGTLEEHKTTLGYLTGRRSLNSHMARRETGSHCVS